MILLRSLWCFPLAFGLLSAQITTIRPISLPQAPWNHGGSWAAGLCSITAANDKCAIIFQVPKTGTITKVRFRTLTVTTGATIDVRMETVAANGYPSGTLWGTNTNAPQVVDASTAYYVGLTAGASATQGDFIAFVLVNPSGAPGSIQFATLPDFWSTTNAAGFPSNAVYASSAWGRIGANAGILYAAFEYSDGSYEFPEGVVPMATFATLAYNSGSSPNHIGLRFQFPVKVRVRGAWFAGYCGANATFNLRLISGGSTSLATLAASASLLMGANASDTNVLTFASSVVLEANTYYRLILQPTTTTNCTLEAADVLGASEVVMGGMPGGADFHWTGATNPTQEGDWTQTATRYPIMGLIIDGIETGGGAVAGAAMPTVISY